ncbi:glutathione peroxidase [Halobacillus naozhouensis]|uniref:Glutathione peroxidase n=1 Tax=Halobacillus naozhouensis TaxID=554880 RepID=A0ABY8J278_9BACI|nr:glutathione peroxidase [Halobacillus naozhouensis]WFT75519.1 glutathione peroxidase [Halobacillus naozhouensis]
MPTVYDYNVKKTDGEIKSLQDFEGRPMIIVNTASKCGFTPQFKGLQELYKAYHNDGLEILGFPSDQFNNQEFDDIDETMQYCQRNYGVSFWMFDKINVKGEEADPLFTFLVNEQKGILSSAIKWNFTKFLINREGQVVERYAPTTDPKKIEKDLKKVL